VPLRPILSTYLTILRFLFEITIVIYLILIIKTKIIYLLAVVTGARVETGATGTTVNTIW
jgi:hypothetical protein